MKIVCCSFVFLAFLLDATAQTQDSYEYQSEFIWGINKNTYGGLIGGFVFKKSRKLNDRVLETYGLELMNVKHPQEIRKTSGTGNYYIYGKNNYLYALRLQYGRDLILFKKAPQQGVEVKAIFAVGPSIGIVAPYFVEYSSDGGGFTSYTAQYDPKNQDQILGTGRLFEGLGQSSIKMGANFKAALNFELGTVKDQVTGFEAGILFDAYTSKVVMMPEATENYSLYPTLFITLFYGNRR
ncbi:MAG: hypothetical protein JNM57_06385 [Cyclobacteriaceae bacterium]|nr:hypothetical protein [Cyclobacteriaceae bacterium]